MTTITLHKVLIQYPKEGELSWTTHPTHRDDAEKFVDLDSASGGYPYATSIDRAYDFKTIEKAEAYRKHFKNNSIRKVKITYEF